METWCIAFLLLFILVATLFGYALADFWEEDEEERK